MDHFSYKNGVLYAEDVNLAELAKKEGTPIYAYSAATLTRHYNVFAEAFKSRPTTICFAVKANSNLAVLKLLGSLGSGADTVSEGEIRRALAAGINPAKIVFSGIGKTRAEMAFALKNNVGQFNVESREELLVLDEVAQSLNVKAPVAIRVNPDVDAKTNEKITTGRKTDKFGVAIEHAPEVYRLAAALKGIDPVGIATHIGSQLTSLEPFDAAFRRIASLATQLKAEGINLSRIDLGGGLGIPYHEEHPPSPQAYAEMTLKALEGIDLHLVLEPGRLICGNAGVLVTEVIYLKRTPERTFVVVDAAMNDLARPSLYGSHHTIVPVIESANSATEVVDVVGPVCESTDVFAKARTLPALKSGDLVAFRSAGAYGAVMASTYNSRRLVPEVLVKGENYSMIRARQSYEEMLALDQIPTWL